MSDLRGRAAPAEVNFGASAKIMAAVLVLAGVGAFAAYGYETGQFKTAPKSVVSQDELPTTAIPSPKAPQ